MHKGDPEVYLDGGNASRSVVRVGQTVRKPVSKSTSSVEAFLAHLTGSGFAHCPRGLGRDEQGRYILQFIEGSPVFNPASLSVEDLREISAIVRTLHEVAAGFPILASQTWEVAIPSDHVELICHNDLGPWNLIRSGDKWIFIDWDGSGPSSRLWDLAYAAQSFVPLIGGGDPDRDAMRLRAFVDGYGLGSEERVSFPKLLQERTFAMYRFLEKSSRRNLEPWARMFSTGHGDHWLKATQYVTEHLSEWASSLCS